MSNVIPIGSDPRFLNAARGALSERAKAVGANAATLRAAHAEARRLMAGGSSVGAAVAMAKRVFRQPIVSSDYPRPAA
ncbi:hypothetical protein [Marilutibacter spongiae]|uniref:Uncharacterized protein n=1 Tax=Marilutibacter spongiae TaxID=2025720 RepID=A0A7W3TL89_9GAMM|nr:hypothetical protein [Lysobacter spongiae]MBB1060387.1 hypothetical protein [Lysobacter spongiae]